MATWREEFERFSELEQQMIVKWQATPNTTTSNLVISAKEATSAFLAKYNGHAGPPLDSEIPRL